MSVDIVVPVYNEERTLTRQILKLHKFLRHTCPWAWTITIVDNASTDQTGSLAVLLARDLHRVHSISLSQKGRGRALRFAWLHSAADVVAYVDLDLSADLAGLIPLLEGPVIGVCDLAVGSRWAPGSEVERSIKRFVISWGFNHLLQWGLGAGTTDAMCGFKAMRKDAFRAVEPEIEDNAFFFDAELLWVAERRGLEILELPVLWIDDPDSRVDIPKTIRDNLKGIWRLWRAGREMDRAVAVRPDPPGLATAAVSHLPEHLGD